MPDPTYNLSGGFKPTIKRFADLNGPDYFSTPRWVTHALIDNEKFSGDIWECACGDGTMSKVLEETGCPVLSLTLANLRFARESAFCRVKGYGANYFMVPAWPRH